jgi:hypothetical protein
VSLDFLSELENKYQLFKSKYPYTRIYLSFNQPTYAAGDSIFFSLHYVHENHQRVKGTHLVNINLVSDEGQTVQRIRFKVVDGLGNNQLVVPGTIKPGIFKIVAFTDWMRNFGSDAFYQTDIPIVSKFQVANADSNKPTVEFFAEGGHLIESINTSILTVGSPNDKLTISDNLGNTVDTIILSNAGTGILSLKPETGKRYYGTSQLNNTKFPLPDVEGDGIGLRLEAGAAWKASISISQNSTFIGQPIYVILVSEGNILFKRELILNGPVSIELPVRVNNALHQVFILDSKAKELAQRIFMPSTGNHVNVKFRLQEKSRQRENFTFAFGIVDESGKLLESDLSLTVFQEGLFNSPQDSTVYTLADLPSVARWANTFYTSYRAHLNDYLISEKWTRIDWESLYRDKAPAFYFPFNNQFKIKGSVLSKSDNKPAPDSTQVIAYLQKNAMGYEAYTKNGNFEIPLVFDFWGEDVIFFTVRKNSKCADAQYAISIAEDNVDLKTNWNSQEKKEEDPYATYALKRNVISKSFTFFAQDNMASMNSKSPNEVLEEEFQGADYVSNVGDYVVFPTMEDFLKEVVSFAQVRKKGTEASIRLYYRYEKSVTFYKQDPIYIIDGIMTSSTAKFLSIKPEDVLSIKIINNPNKLSQLGSLGQYGVIFIESKKGNLFSKVTENLFPVIGLSQSVWKPEHATILTKMKAGIPDLRSTLYWNPSIKSDLKGFNEITFMTSDDAGPMRIKVQGITTDGKPFSADNSFSVGLNSNRK